jgi:hypothetical protein
LILRSAWAERLPKRSAHLPSSGLPAKRCRIDAGRLYVAAVARPLILTLRE